MSELNRNELNERQDRQMRTYGKEACLKLNNSNVILKGLSNNLGTEIAKNLALGGVKNLFLCDNNKINKDDIEAGFYFSEESLGKNRAENLKDSIQELNPYTNISIIDSGKLDNFISTNDNSVLILVNELRIQKD